MPRGEIGDNQKFICVFHIGLVDDEEFCLVKRILGKAGNNMRRIAEECSAKVRLRGIGSGFLEGADGREANMPLQLNVSCTDFDSYYSACERVAALLKDLYKHYRRYARSKGMEPPDVKLNLEEVRRDDCNVDLLSQKAQRSSSQRERDRRARQGERRDKLQAPVSKDGGAGGLGDSLDRSHASARLTGTEAGESAEEGEEAERGSQAAAAAPLLLPGGLPVPTTAAGRRAAAKAGGAAAAAKASAALRETERLERDRRRETERLAREERKGGYGPRGMRGGKAKGKGAPPPPPGPPPSDAVQVGAWSAGPLTPEKDDGGRKQKFTPKRRGDEY